MSSTPKPAKTMSSRLLTMRFMQRSAASSPTTSSPNSKNSPTASSGTSPRTTRDSQQRPPSKRQRLSNGTSASVPSTPLSNSDQTPNLNHDQFYDEAMRAALAAEEALRAQADERRAKIRGESRWTLSFRDPQYPGRNEIGRGEEEHKENPAVPLQVITAGYGDIDVFTAVSGGGKGASRRDTEYANVVNGSDELGSMRDSVPGVGRRTFGKFKRRTSEGTGDDNAAAAAENTEEEEEEDDDDEDSDEDEDDDDTDDSESTSSVNSETSDSASSPSTRSRHIDAKEGWTRKANISTASSKTSKDYRLPISQLPQKQKKVSARKLTSISAAGTGRSSATNDSQIVCHRCRLKGHKIKDCPKMVREKNSGEQRGTGLGARGWQGYRKAPMGLS